MPHAEAEWLEGKGDNGHGAHIVALLPPRLLLALPITIPLVSRISSIKEQWSLYRSNQVHLHPTLEQAPLSSPSSHSFILINQTFHSFI